MRALRNGTAFKAASCEDHTISGGLTHATFTENAVCWQALPPMFSSCVTHADAASDVSGSRAS